MNSTEKIKKYIEATKIDAGRYDMRPSEVLELACLAKDAPWDAICLAFKYGYAKRQRAATKGVAV